jgi:hypothetical protein
MSILWVGGEDLDFPNGNSLTVSTTSGNRRTSYSRCDISNHSSGVVATARSLPFVGGAITSAWLHAQVLAQSFTSARYLGLALNSVGNSGLYVGTDATTGNKTALWKLDGSTWTSLATETGTSISNGAINQIDMNVASFGASATVTVYVNGVLVITYSGSTTITSVTSLDCVAIMANSLNGYSISEIIVADADTRALSLMTMAPNAAGDTNNWTNAYTNINPTTINDSNVIFVNTTGQDFEANLTDLASGTFSIQAVKVAARAEVTAGSTPTGIKLGVKTGGTVNVDTAHTLTSSFATYERLMAVNPVTSAAWAQSDMNALQMDLQSS